MNNLWCRARALLWFGVGLAGCSEVTALSMDIVTDGKRFGIYAREVERPDCTCNSGNFPAVGGCEGINDGITCTCDPGPAHCLSRVSALRDGEVVASEPVDTENTWFGYVGLRSEVAADRLRIEGCGTVIDLPLDYSYSTPTITGTVEDPPGTLQIEWTTTPAAPFALVSAATLSGVSCLDEDDGEASVELWPYDLTRISIRTVDLDTQTTPLGTARVWFGGEAELDWSSAE